MPSPNDLRNEQSAYAHIQAAKAAPHRMELELNQAENFARLIMDRCIQQEVRRAISNARLGR
jgi:hypothetical protein